LEAFQVVIRRRGGGATRAPRGRANKPAELALDPAPPPVVRPSKPTGAGRRSR
jgi:hypothetical protein